ncbi:hypothetical protein [Rubritalea profundi]|uniref:EF-hand domain-containing protein n=1 Tax=Rubritalea profundi TaxID=1658618 RepID=A0A2S7U1W1_9BACT|nr:hypothetical protein [Rubritalea profundi]PQJ28968.1 hypothetical protein BSZ32_11025 [Rubritalea profundi]
MKSSLIFIATFLWALTAQAAPRMNAMVVHFDLDSNGSLSASELKDLARSLGEIFEPDSPQKTPSQPPSEKLETYVETETKALPTERELYEESIAEARQVALDWCDTDENRKISREEKQRIVEALRGDIKGTELGSKDTAMIETFLLAFNQDGSKVLSTQERLEAVRFIETYYTKTPEEFAELQDKCIKQVDQNDDWLLSPAEKKRASELLRAITKETDISDELIFAFDFDENETLSTAERNRAMQLIEDYFRPIPLTAVEKSTGESSDAPSEHSLDLEYIAASFLKDHDVDISQSLNYDELVAALNQAKLDGLFRTRSLTVQSLRAERVSKIRRIRAELMQYFDQDSNESLSKGEIVQARDALRGRIRGKRVGENDDAMVAKVITAFDTDGSGTVSVGERDAAIKSIGRHFQPVPLESGGGKPNKKKSKKVKPKEN